MVGPIRYAILTVTILVLLGQAERALFPPEVMPGWDAARTHALYAAQDLRAYLIVVILVPVALAQWVLFRREGFNFAECYAFSAYVFGHLVWLEILRSLFSLVTRNSYLPLTPPPPPLPPPARPPPPPAPSECRAAS